MGEGNAFDRTRRITLTEEELRGLILCVSLDIVEYVLSPLLLPIIGDLVDVVGIIFCIHLFGWIGFLSLLEFVPGADILPIYTVTWFIWYSMKNLWGRRKEKKLR